jgi:hypothetical protein
MAVSFDVERSRTFERVLARLAPPVAANWGYETSAAYGQPASEEHDGAASDQLLIEGRGAFDDEFELDRFGDS